MHENLVILIDFGATRVKCVVWNLTSDCKIEMRETEAPKQTMAADGAFEIEPEQYWKCFLATAGVLAEKYHSVTDIWICSEMHGAMLTGARHEPLTPYISWRDERATRKPHGNPSTMDMIPTPERASFFNKTGMRIKSGLPILSFTHLFLHGMLPSGRLTTLVDWLLLRGGSAQSAIHASLAAGTGFYDIHKRQWSDTLLSCSSEPHRGPPHGIKLDMPNIAKAGERLGSITLSDRKLHVYGGFGDLQSAAYGAGFPHQDSMLVNLGTGSQILATDESDEMEKRIGADDSLFRAITHIPCGRALNVFSEFIDHCSQSGGGTPIFWDKFINLSPTQIEQSNLSIDLNIFESSWKHTSAGSIGRIAENNFNADSLIASIAKAWVLQYATAMKTIDPTHAIKSFILSGGLAHKTAFMLPLLAENSQRTGRHASIVTGEETLDGLLQFARKQHTRSSMTSAA